MSVANENWEAPSFKGWPSISRFRDMIVTEKLDGTNAQVCITDEGKMWAGSRTRWITPENDNYGFAKWVLAHQEELLKLGPGSHFGEWWGPGIQRRYGVKEKRFSLFNVGRWGDDKVRPACCHVVPVLYEGVFDVGMVDTVLAKLDREGSVASPGFMLPEGVVVWHEASRTLFKRTLDGDGHKGREGGWQQA